MYIPVFMYLPKVGDDNGLEFKGGDKTVGLIMDLEFKNHFKFAHLCV